MLKTKLTLVFFLLIFNVALPQSQTLDKYIQEKILKINQNIEAKEFDLALNKIEEIETYSDYMKMDKNRFNLDLLKAKSFYGIGEQEKAVNLSLITLDELDSKPNVSKLKINFYLFLAEIFREASNFNKSISYSRQSLNSSIISNDTINILKSYLEIGRSFRKLSANDSAIYYYNNILKYPININTQDIISYSYNNLGNIYIDYNNLDSAEVYYKKTLEIKEKYKDTIGKTAALNNLSAVYYKRHQYDKAQDNFKEIYSAVKDMKSTKALNIKESSLLNLAYVNEDLGNFKEAYYFLIEAYEISGSLTTANIDQKITETEAKYNVAKEAQKTEEEKSKRLRAQVFFYGLAFAFLSFMVLGYIFYRNYRLKQQSKVEQIENEAQTRIINATIDAKEKERKSIAETLHDSVSALLSSANLHLQATKAQLKKEAPQEISKAQTIVNEASVKIRDLSHELISSVLLKFGLAFAVHDMCQKYSNSELTLHSDDNGIKRYDQDFEIKIYNIIEELINNILKHSKASNATIMLAHRENDMLSIRISDDGIGFNVKTARNKDGLGLSHINARVKVMKGVFNIVSSKDNGTSIFILVPIKFKK